MEQFKLTWNKELNNYEQILTWKELISGSCVAFGGKYSPMKIEKINK